MEIIAGLALSLIAIILLAAVGLTTVVALGLMMVMGLLTNMSFKRLFFVSFAMGLAAPVMLGAATFAAIEDGSFESDLRRDLEGIVQLPDDQGRAWGENLGEGLDQLREIGQEVDRGNLTESEAEERAERIVRDVFGGDVDRSEQPEPPEQPALPAPDGDTDEPVTIEIDGVELSRDGDEVRINID